MLFLIFLILKVTGAVEWSWWWVTAPIWMPAALVVGGLLLAAVMGVSVYKIVKSVLSRQAFRQSRGANGRSAATSISAGEVLEAEGSEVTRTPADPSGPAGPAVDE
jgi:hypothetical protein